MNSVAGLDKWPPDIGIDPYYCDKWRVIYKGDCVKVMSEMPSASVDLTITSPPYDKLRDYNGYSFDFDSVARELWRLTKQGGVAVWVVGDRIKNGSETLTPFQHALSFKDIGFRIHDTMIYQKNVMPFPEQTRYIQCFEYMFVLSKGKPKTTNLLKEPTKGYKPSATSSQRNADGSVSKLKYEQGKKERSRWNVWVYDVGYGKTTLDKDAYQHPAMFPERLARDHIISWCKEGDTVFDPMCGSGTTLKMAGQLNRKCIGIEISEEYCDIAANRCAADTISRIQKGEY